MLVDSPHWPAGTILQMPVREYWYGHDCVSEYVEECIRQGCTILGWINREHRPAGEDFYLSDEAARAHVHRICPTNPLYQPQETK